MKSQISFIAVGLVVATADVGFATVGRLPALPPHETVVPVRVAEAAGTSAPPRVSIAITAPKVSQADSIEAGSACPSTRLRRAIEITVWRACAVE